MLVCGEIEIITLFSKAIEAEAHGIMTASPKPHGRKRLRTPKDRGQAVDQVDCRSRTERSEHHTAGHELTDDKDWALNSFLSLF